MGGKSGLSCGRGKSGQGITEYLIILALIAIAAIGVYSFFGQSAVRQPPVGSPEKAAARDAAGAPAQIPAQTDTASSAAAKEAGDTKTAGSK